MANIEELYRSETIFDPSQDVLIYYFPFIESATIMYPYFVVIAKLVPSWLKLA